MSHRIQYFSLDKVRMADIPGNQIFIIANERRKMDGKIGRYYTIFPSFDDFLKNRNLFPNCHELIMDHVNVPKNIGGRLVFDFDIKIKKIPKDFKHQIESTIVLISKKNILSIQTDKFIFVWSSSENPD